MLNHRYKFRYNAANLMISELGSFGFQISKLPFSISTPVDSFMILKIIERWCFEIKSKLWGGINEKLGSCSFSRSEGSLGRMLVKLHV
jgi:hypothetical protein